MEYYDERARLYLAISDDLRQRDLNRWNAAFRAWREAHGVLDIPLSKLSNNEYNCAVLYAAIKAEWITASGRKNEAGELTLMDSVPDDAEELETWKPGLVQWYGERVQLVYAQLFDISPK